MTIKKAVDVEAGTVSLTFEDGDTLVCDIDKVPEATARQLMLHGLSQKEGDSYAGSKEIREAGGDVNQWAKDQATRVWQNILDGLWTVRGEGGARVTQLAQAVFDVYSKKQPELTLEAVAEKLADMNKEDKAKLGKAKSIAARLATIQAEKAKAKAEAAAKAAEGEEAEEAPDLF